MRSILCVICLMLSFQTHATDKWDSIDKALLVTAETMWMLDWNQTRRASNNPDKYVEANAMLGEHPSKSEINSYMAAMMIGTAATAYLLPGAYRKIWLIGVTISEASFVRHNLSVGVNIKF